MIFFELFYTFFFIGMFTIGGGYAMLTLIQHQVVTVHGWISAEAFTDIIAISQMTPGPIGINSATYIGYSVIEAMGYSPARPVRGRLFFGHQRGGAAVIFDNLLDMPPVRTAQEQSCIRRRPPKL